MDPFQPKPEDLPTEFAVFPLTGALMLPRGKLPLNIFEPRYLAMTLDSLAAGRMFGMIQPDPNAPKTDSGPGLYRIGCLGRLSSFSETDDGRLLITLTGLIRFSIVSELEVRNGYRRVHGDFSRFAADLGEPQAALFDREAILAALRSYFTRRGVEANWDAIKRMDDDMLVITLSMACPFEPVEKQALLEAQTGTDRAETLLALLQMGAAGPESTSGHSVS
ncbi:MAG TPA: LON peptidase substrate-binding domain-containing protein [Rhodopila sp.]|jgi:Lon protease-like protein|nr:LON peptidase substrate-binding domain-containing protein [Rhodopila sp.]